MVIGLIFRASFIFPILLAMTEAAALFEALTQLTEQVKAMTDRGDGGGGQKRWDTLDKYRNLKMFDGKTQDFEEWNMKFRSLVITGDRKVGKMMKGIESDCTEDELAKGNYQELAEFGAQDSEFVLETSASMFNILLNLTTGEANAVVRKSSGHGWLAWKRLTSSLNPRTLASGIKAISAVLIPPKVNQAMKADHYLDEWEDKLAKLNIEYGQNVTAKVQVAVLYGMMPKDLQEKILDECAVNWDQTNEGQAAALLLRIKSNVRNVAKARREMAGPRPMEVDHVSAWEEWAWGDEWDDGNGMEENGNEEKEEGEAYIRYVGKGGGKKGGKGFQGHCYACGEFGHSQRDCGKGKGKSYSKGFGKNGAYSKGYGKDDAYGNYSKGYGKGDAYGNYSKGYSKGYGKDGAYGKGSGKDGGKGGMPRACFGCGSTEHLMRDCPKRGADIQRVKKEEEPEEVMFIGNVRKEEGSWRQVPMKVTLGDFVRAPRVNTRLAKKEKIKNRFEVLQPDEDGDESTDEEAFYVRTVENVENKVEAGRKERPKKRKTKMMEYTPKCHEGSCGCEDKKAKHETTHEKEFFVNAVGQDNEWTSLCKGDIIVDSAADESCWPVGEGDAYPTKAASRRMLLRTANGGDMEHYGEKEIIFKYEGGEMADPVGLRFQVTDVRKPLLAVRRLVEKGNKVILAGGDGESYIMNEVTGVKIPIKKKGGSFVIEAHFVMRGF